MPFISGLDRKLIDEALNYDKIMNQRAFGIETLNGKKENEGDLQEYTQLNAGDIAATNELVNNLIVLLEKKNNELDKFIRNNSIDVSQTLSSIEDVINSYNKIVSIYLNPANTQQTRAAILTSIMKIERYIRPLETNSIHVLNRLYTIVTNKTSSGESASIVFKPCFRSYVAYNLIKMQLSNGTINIISNEDLIRHYNNVCRANPHWYNFLKLFGYPDYNPLDIQGPSGKGPPPPPPQPPGGFPSGGFPGSGGGDGGGGGGGGDGGDGFETANDDTQLQQRVQQSRQRPSRRDKEIFMNILKHVFDVDSQGIKSRPIPKSIVDRIYNKIKFPELQRLLHTGGNQAVIDRRYKELCEIRHVDYQVIASQLAPQSQSFNMGSDDDKELQPPTIREEDRENIEPVIAPTAEPQNPASRSANLEEEIRQEPASSSLPEQEEVVISPRTIEFVSRSIETIGERIENVSDYIKKT